MVNLTSMVGLAKLPYHHEDNGELVVIEGLTHIPFGVARVFVVRASMCSVRGQHAHKECSQFLTCPIGSVEVLCDDGITTATYVLGSPDVGLLIPPGIWAQQTYQVQNSILMVLCDKPYNENDYIREYSEFKEYRRTSGSLDGGN